VSGVRGGGQQCGDLGLDEGGAGLVELGRGAVGLDHRDVHPQRARDGDAATGDARVVEQLLHEVALRTADGQHCERGGPLGGERAGDVDSLAAGVDPARRGPVDLAAAQVVDGDGAVDAGVGSEGDDHVR
jgi:hypothetical protein